jgi:hypothetical protein
MKHFIVILISLLFTRAYGQTFEGKITYNNNYTSKIPNVQDQQFNSMMGTIQEYYIKGGDYKSNSNGTLIQWQLYFNKENRIYNKISSSETILWNDCAINPDSIIRIEINKDVTEILGYMCDEVILYCVSGTQKYFFNHKIAVDISLFKNHLFGNWYDFLKVSKSLPLKSIIENQQFVVVSEAKDIKEINLDGKEFLLPENVKIAKSPY